MRVTNFGSGSCGNAFLIQSGRTAVLIDAGVSIRRLRSGLVAAGVTRDGLTAVLVSHEHHDHVRSLPQLLHHHESVVMASPGTLAALDTELAGGCQSLVSGRQQQVGSIEVTPVPVSHDAADPVGFLIDDGETQVAIFTDLGRPDARMTEAIECAHLVILESNYDDLMLERGRYPRHLKRRVGGSRGHLSNRDCARFLAQNLGKSTVEIWLAHLSENNNTPTHARAALAAELSANSGTLRIRVLPRRGTDMVWDSDDVGDATRQLWLPLN
jgi:phosphoribosyl 1,2-cyclic phosphodiesterase